jgi:hypothetical protein
LILSLQDLSFLIGKMYRVIKSLKEIL